MLKFTGIGSAFNLKDGSNSAYFEENNHLFLIDCGETTFKSMMNKVDFKTYDSVTVLITHFHNDHIGSLGTMISYLYLEKGVKINVVHPLAKMVKLLELMGIESNMYHYDETPEYKLDRVKVSFIETQHVKNMTCYSLEIKIKDQFIFYSSDSKEIPEEILKKLLDGYYERFYQDTTILDTSSGTHLNYKKLISLVPENILEKVYCMHLDENSKVTLEENGLKTVKLFE